MQSKRGHKLINAYLWRMTFGRRLPITGQKQIPRQGRYGDAPQIPQRYRALFPLDNLIFQFICWKHFRGANEISYNKLSTFAILPATDGCEPA